jgi:hypothetical protein
MELQTTDFFAELCDDALQLASQAPAELNPSALGHAWWKENATAITADWVELLKSDTQDALEQLATLSTQAKIITALCDELATVVDHLVE